MSDNGADSACCSSSNLVDNADNVGNSTDPFQIDHWNPDVEGHDEQPNDINVGVFNQDNETASVSYMENTIRLEFSKFAKSLKISDFREFVRKYVGEENLEKLENCKYPNLWIMQVKTKEIREKVLRIWKTKIKNKTCWINPYYEYELRGFLHWLPHFISDGDVKRQLSQFGDVLLLENEVHDYWSGEIKSEVKYFGLRLKDGMVKNDLPHFLKFGGYRTLVIVRGRKPACFHCREFGHSKKDCKKYKEKLDEYCKNPEARRPRTKPRGRRHRPDSDAKDDSEDNKHQNETNSTSTGIIPAQKDSKLVKYCPERAYSDMKSTDDKKKVEILAILRSLKEWKEEITEMVEQTLKNIEKNSRMNLTPTELTESEEESIKFSIEIITKLLGEMKQITIEMIEETLNNLKNVVAQHFGLDSNEPLEKLISNFETSRKEKLEPKEVKFLEEQLFSYT
ncbi:hypothetical protein AVEN_121140-1 [Araneus ventricosus]|uniref:CCHC-type domain-containing protein n=1 Tax=Araneus ventricosus TaxID=182803 RepID=A0A4Y2DZT7_ARAVE|nr:hypothetical protein AVEN_121140-1 [Araneus ventricosus]